MVDQIVQAGGYALVHLRIGSRLGQPFPIKPLDPILRPAKVPPARLQKSLACFIVGG
jgi:hypothetical protein